MARFTNIPTFSFMAMAAFGFFFAWSTGSNAVPRIVVTIKPIHSLAAGVLEGVTEPKLLLQGAASPHSYALKPSDAKAISEADAIIFASRNLEVFLEKPIEALPANARVIDLDETPGLKLLPVREAGLREAKDEEEDGQEGHFHNHTGFDVHFWLDPANAIVMVRRLAVEFSALDAQHEAQYRANAIKLELALTALDAELRAMLAGLSGKPFIVFHDVTQYLEKRYGLNSAGAITLSPEREPGAKRLAAVRAKIEETRAICVFSEPEFPPKLVQMLTAGTNAKRGVLDEVGAAIPPGPAQYFALMRTDAESLAACLRS